MTEPGAELLPLLLTRAQARAEGFTDRRVSRLVQAGAWSRVRRGHLVTLGVVEPDQRWRAAVLAVQAAHGRGPVLAGAHAARAWGLPEPLDGSGDMTFVCTQGPTRSRAGLVVRVAPLAPDEVTRIGSALVTTVARTVVDCARTLPGRDALAIADRALRQSLVSGEQLREALARQKGWPGAVRARVVVELADGRRETPLESWSAWCFAELALPSPRWQLTVLDADGVFVGRVDALWPNGVAGEADGQAKYALGSTGPEDDARAVVAAVHAQRLREIALRRTGLAVVRWGAVDLFDARRADALGEHLQRELAVPRIVTARIIDS